MCPTVILQRPYLYKRLFFLLAYQPITQRAAELRRRNLEDVAGLGLDAGREAEHGRAEEVAVHVAGPAEGMRYLKWWCSRLAMVCDMFSSPVRKSAAHSSAPLRSTRTRPLMLGGRSPTSSSGPIEQVRSLECAR